MKKNGKKVFWCSILFQLNLANLQPVAALISTVGKPSFRGPQTTFTVNHKPQSNFYKTASFQKEAMRTQVAL